LITEGEASRPVLASGHRFDESIEVLMASNPNPFPTLSIGDSFYKYMEEVAKLSIASANQESLDETASDRVMYTSDDANKHDNDQQVSEPTRSRKLRRRRLYVV